MGHNCLKVGEKFNFLTIVEKTNQRNNNGCVIYKCLCDCGSYTFVSSNNLKSGHTKSCGCYAIKKSFERMKQNSKLYLQKKKPIVSELNKIIKNDKYIEIICKDKKIIIDEEDYKKINFCKWFVNKNGYGCNSKGILLHRIIMGAKKQQLVDHINRNTLDNRKNNLRFVNRSQNSQNRKCKGISYDKSRKKWQVSITVNKKRYNLGRYEDEEKALEVRRNAEIKYQGEYRAKDEN